MRQRPAAIGVLAVAAALLTAATGHAVAPPLPGISTQSIPSFDTDIPIPDNGYVVSVLNVPGGGTVVDVDVVLDIEHTRAQDLDVSLIAPSGRTITLTSDNGADAGGVFRGTTFDDQAPAAGFGSAPNIRNFAFADLVSTGPVQPEQALGALVGEPAAGPWVLVILDDAGGGNVGVLHTWSLVVSTLGYVTPAPPVTFSGQTLIDIEGPEGAQSTATVSGLPPRLHDVDVTVQITHGDAADLDIFLSSPSGRRIDLATDVGGGNSDLFDGATFDDAAELLVGDAELPDDGDSFELVVPEGALGAFVGEDPNGQWTLTVLDDTAGYSGTLEGWSLAITVATACGDGTLDTGEVCDDGNPTNGDGCDVNCTQTACGNGIVSPGEDCDDGNTVGGDACPSTCKNGEVVCDDCVDNDGNGLVDMADPACEPTNVNLLGASISTARGKLRLTGAVPVPQTLTGQVNVVLADAGGPIVCGPTGEITAGRRRSWVMRGGTGTGSLTLKLTQKKGGSLLVTGKGLDLAELDDPNVSFAFSVGSARFAAGGTFRRRGGTKFVFP